MRRSSLIARARLVLAVGASLALTACTSDPTAPGARAPAAAASVAAMGHVRSQSVTGTFDGTESGEYQPATNAVLLTLVGSGTASHLGRYSSVSRLTLDIASGTTVGTTTLTAADGSTITASVTGVGIATNGISRIVETATVTGGTGRFRGASGTLIVERTLDQASGVSSGSITGRVIVGA